MWDHGGVSVGGILLGESPTSYSLLMTWIHVPPVMMRHSTCGTLTLRGNPTGLGHSLWESPVTHGGVCTLTYVQSPH